MSHRLELSRPFDIVSDSYGGSQMWHNSRRRTSTGCGPAALANLYAWHHALTLSRQDMLLLQDRVWRHLKGPVIGPRQFLRGARRLFGEDADRIHSMHLTILGAHDRSLTRAVRFIERALLQGDPPALLIGPQRPGADYHKDFQNHWVLITALETDGSRVLLTVSSWGSAFTLDLKDVARSKFFFTLVWLKPIRRD